MDGRGVREAWRPGVGRGDDEQRHKCVCVGGGVGGRGGEEGQKGSLGGIHGS